MKINKWVAPSLAVVIFSSAGAFIVREWSAPMTPLAPADSSAPSWGLGGKRSVTNRELTPDQRRQYEAQLRASKDSKLSGVANKKRPTLAVSR